MSAIEPNSRVTFRVVQEDADVVVVEKPARLVTHPGVGHEHDTLLNGLFARYGERLTQMGEARDWGLVHRLDRETSGVLVVALSHAAYDGLRAQFAGRTVGKFYWALTHKAPREASGVIRRPIGEVVERATKYTSIKRAKVSAAGKPAVTAYRVLAANDLGALVECRPVTGRMHQIRVHLDLIGCAIVGDELYGPRLATGGAPRVALHAHRLRFAHPVTGRGVDVRTAWPKDLRATLRRMQLPRPDLLEGGEVEGEVGEGDGEGE